MTHTPGPVYARTWCWHHWTTVEPHGWNDHYCNYEKRHPKRWEHRCVCGETP